MSVSFYKDLTQIFLDLGDDAELKSHDRLKVTISPPSTTAEAIDSLPTTIDKVIPLYMLAYLQFSKQHAALSIPSLSEESKDPLSDTELIPVEPDMDISITCM